MDPKLIGYVFLSVLSGCLGAELRFLWVPDSVSLPEDAKLLRSQVTPVLRNIMGFSTNVGAGWKGSGDLLKRPEAVAIVSVVSDDEKHQHLPEGQQSYKLLVEDEASVGSLKNDLVENFPDGGYTYLEVSTKIEGTHAEELNQMTSIESLKSGNVQLQKELENLRTITQWLHTGESGVRNGVPDVYIFRFLGLTLGKDSKDSRVFNEELGKMVKMLKKAYGNNCVVALITSSPQAEQQRVKRETLEAAASTNSTNIYPFYGVNYSAGFNIVLFTSLVLALTVVFIAVGMWYMDPGKDSIIYRMTMTRAKKD